MIAPAKIVVTALDTLSRRPGEERGAMQLRSAIRRFQLLWARLRKRLDVDLIRLASGDDSVE